MTLTAEQIHENWETFISYINEYIQGERKDKLLEFYKLYADRLVMMPASNKKDYHSAIPGGYIYHVNNVIKNSLLLYNVWELAGADMTTFTIEELIFSAINHDLGKMGDEKNEVFIPQTDNWRKEKLGEEYTFNTEIAFSSVPDRGLYMLQKHGIQYSFNEMIAIQTHDGLYDKANEKYLMGYIPEVKPRTSLVYILHQADLMSARIEFELDWKGKFSKDNLEPVKKDGKLKGVHNKKDKALSSVKSQKLSSFLENITE